MIVVEVLSALYENAGISMVLFYGEDSLQHLSSHGSWFVFHEENGTVLKYFF